MNVHIECMYIRAKLNAEFCTRTNAEFCIRLVECRILRSISHLQNSAFDCHIILYSSSHGSALVYCYRSGSKHKHTHTHTYIHTHAQTHTHIHTHIYTHTQDSPHALVTLPIKVGLHTHTHTHKHTGLPSCPSYTGY